MASNAMRELRIGVRRGLMSALDALLYQCADGMYAMALSAMPDESAAQEVVREAWRRLLWALRAARFDRAVDRRVWALTEQVLAERLDRAAAKRARQAVTGEDGSIGIEGVRLPREVLDELSALSEQHSQAIAARWRLRRRVFRASLVALFAAALGVWGAVFYQRARATGDLAQLQYDCLRQRIIRQELAALMREISFQLDDPTGADRLAAADCERVLLALEEIANSESLRQVNGLRYVRARIAKHDLAQFVLSLEEQFPEAADALPRVALVLEEVLNQ
ncbi:MAG: hypothetical protein AB7Y46_05285 [Armatimonadota bacterium]